MAACATMSLWVANNKINSVFKTQLLSPLEITNRATNLVETSRSIPNQGLSTRQMLSFLKSISLDFEILNVLEMDERSKGNDEYKKEYKNIVPDVVRAFTEAQIPLIANLILIRHEEPESHSVVISGYEEDQDGDISKIYAHDDVIGPFCEVESASDRLSFSKWSCEWTKESEWAKNGDSKIFYLKCQNVCLDEIIIPLYPKIRLGFKIIYKVLLFFKKKARAGENFILYLTTVQRYKNGLLSKNFENKMQIMREPMPRFIWVIASVYNRKIFRETLYDATSHMLREIKRIDFK